MQKKRADRAASRLFAVDGLDEPQGQRGSGSFPLVGVGGASFLVVPRFDPEPDRARAQWLGRQSANVIIETVCERQIVLGPDLRPSARTLRAILVMSIRGADVRLSSSSSIRAALRCSSTRAAALRTSRPDRLGIEHITEPRLRNGASTRELRLTESRTEVNRHREQEGETPLYFCEFNQRSEGTDV